MTQGHADTEAIFRLYIPIDFMSNGILSLCAGLAFFDKSGGTEIKKDTMAPPGYRRVLKNGRL